ncbi:MAG TPA: ABC transporter permease [Terriglobales bacterium]|nr:ABC transporter permease [Terriglobales bacterium]
MNGLLQDLRYAVRQLRKNVAFTIVAVTTLGLGIGANTAVFSALNALLLKLLPIRNPEQVYTVVLMNGGTQPPNTDGTGNGNTSFSLPVFQALRNQKRLFADLIAHVPLGYGKVPVRFGEIPIEKAGEEVSGNYFSGLGVQFARGIGLMESDETQHTPVVVLSYGFWTEAFSRNPAVLGQTLYIKGVPFTIIGVTAQGFLGVEPARGVDFWIPLQTRPELNAWGVPATNHTLYSSSRWWALPMVARLQKGVTPEQAQQAAEATFWHAATEPLGKLDFKAWPAHLGFEPIRGVGNYAENYREPLKIMMALVGLVLLIACTNVALLILARNAARQSEFAVRLAIGAHASRLFRQLLTESLLLTAAGAVLGWALAIAATRALALWGRIDAGLAPDKHVLIFTVAIASLTAFVFGLVPLHGVMRIAVEQELKSSSATATLSRRRVHAGNVAIAMQIAMCLALLVAASLSIRSLLHYKEQDLGMRAESLLVFDLNPQGLSTNAKALSFYERLLERAKAIPGVQAVSLVRTRPGSGWINSSGVTVDGIDMRQDASPHVSISENSVGPNFFHTLGIPVLEGRDMSDSDTPTSAPVALVNETFAARFLKQGALGHRIGNLPGAEIVGVVKDSKDARVREASSPAAYYPLTQTGMLGQITVEVSTAADPMTLLAAMREAVRELDPNLPLQKPMTQAAQFAESYVTPTLFARLSIAFGVLAILLVGSGLYGTLAYRVQRRTNEIGIRMALGAARESVLWMIASESLLLLGMGVAVGLPITVIIARLLRSQLYQVDYLDAFSFAVAVAMTFLVAIAAALIPARRAAKVDPMVALRYE